MRKRISRKLSCVLAAVMLITSTGICDLSVCEAYGMTLKDAVMTDDTLGVDDETFDELTPAAAEEEASVEEPVFEDTAELAEEEDVLLTEPEGDSSDLPTGTMFTTYINNGHNTNVVSSGSIVPMGTDIYGLIYTYKDEEAHDHRAFYVWPAGDNTNMSDSYWDSSKNGYYNDSTLTLKNADTIVVETGIEYLGDRTFYGGGAVNVFLPDSITGLGGYAFSKMAKLSFININNCTGLERVSTGAFAETSVLEGIVFPASIKTIGTAAFKASGFKSLVLPPALSTLEDNAFQNCPYLVSTEENPIIIPKSLKSVYVGGAFTGCPEIKTMAFEEGMKKIPQNILYNCDNVTSVKLPSTAVEIGMGAFQNSDALKTVDFNNAKITKMEQQVFEGCTALENITLPASLTQMGTSVFKGCTSLKSIKIPEGVTELDHTFEGCTLLESVELPDTLVKLSNYCFGDCTSLKDINWPSSLAYIGEKAFRQTALKGEIRLPDRVAEIGDFAFSTCLSANKLVFPGSICKIGINPFYDVAGVTYEYCGNEQEWKRVSIIKPGTSSPYTDNSESEITKHLTYTINEYVEPTGVSIKKSSFKVGDTFKLEAVVSPEDASQNVTWKGYNSSYAKPAHFYTWNSASNYTTGEFKALKAGEFNVTCASKDGKVSETFKITITEGGDEPGPTPPGPQPPAPGPDQEEKLYAITVQDGASAKIGDKKVYSARTGDTVNISYNRTQSGVVFEKWEVKGATLSDASIPKTSFVMGTEPVQVRYTVSVNPESRKEELPKDADTSTKVSKLAFEKKALKLKTGEVKSNKATPAMSGGTAPAVQYITGNADIVSVSPDGSFIAMGPGKTVVTAYCGDKTAACKVTVDICTTDIAILNNNDADVTGTTINMKAGEQAAFHVSFLPGDTSDPRAIKWKSSNAKAVTVKNGLITVKDVKAAAEATITATAACTDTGSGKTISKTVTVKVEPVKLEPPKKEAGHKLSLKKSLKMVTTKDKNKAELGITLTAKKGGSVDKCRFDARSTNDRVISINKIGDLASGTATVSIEAIRPGTAYIEVTSWDPADESKLNRQRCKVTVTSPAESVKVTADSLGLLKTEGTTKSITIREGQYDDLTAVIDPDFSTDAAKGIKWKGSGGVTVKNGLLYAKKETNSGKVTVKCGKQKEIINVTVVRKK